MLSHRTETTITQKGVLRLESLPFEQGDKVKITILKQAETHLQRRKRALGKYAGKIWIADDFDAPLPDDFWLGKSD